MRQHGQGNPKDRQDDRPRRGRQLLTSFKTHDCTGNPRISCSMEAYLSESSRQRLASLPTLASGIWPLVCVCALLDALVVSVVICANLNDCWYDDASLTLRIKTRRDGMHAAIIAAVDSVISHIYSSAASSARVSPAQSLLQVVGEGLAQLTSVWGVQVVKFETLDNSNSAGPICGKGCQRRRMATHVGTEDENLQDAHAHSNTNTNLLLLPHLETPQKGPRYSGEREVH